MQGGGMPVAALPKLKRCLRWARQQASTVQGMLDALAVQQTAHMHQPVPHSSFEHVSTVLNQSTSFTRLSWLAAGLQQKLQERSQGQNSMGQEGPVRAAHAGHGVD